MRISGWSSDVCSSDLRLLLCLYGLGTNAGLKRIAGATPDVCYEELLHVHRRFVHAAALKEACARVANATLAIRNAAVWGDAGTACASDSTKFGAWEDRKSTRPNSSPYCASRMPFSDC